ncbi:MAG: hypothetical protein ACK5JO_03885 [Halodesulfovibrio sp.]
MITRFRIKATRNVKGEFVRYTDHLAVVQQHNTEIRDLRAQLNELQEASQKVAEPREACAGCLYLRHRRAIYSQQVSAFCILRNLFSPSPFVLDGRSCRVEVAAEYQDRPEVQHG